MYANLLTVAVHVSGDKWGTTKWVPLACEWTRLDSAIVYGQQASGRYHNGSFGYRVYDKDGVVYAEG